MGILRSLRGDRDTRTPDDYVDLADHVGDGQDGRRPPDNADMQLHIAEIGEQQDVIAITDAVYDGDMVIADFTRLRTSDATTKRITEQLHQTATEIGGDIVQKGDDQVIITPAGTAISREKLR